MQVTIKERSSGLVLADAKDAAVQKIEGNWYIDPGSVSQELLETTTHEYHCPYKGRCFYVDYVHDATRVERVAWIYDDPKTGWEHIKGKYGFYAGEAATKIGKTTESVAP